MLFSFVYNALKYVLDNPESDNFIVKKVKPNMPITAYESSGDSFTLRGDDPDFGEIITENFPLAWLCEVRDDIYVKLSEPKPKKSDISNYMTTLTEFINADNNMRLTLTDLRADGLENIIMGDISDTAETPDKSGYSAAVHITGPAYGGKFTAEVDYSAAVRVTLSENSAWDDIPRHFGVTIDEKLWPAGKQPVTLEVYGKIAYEISLQEAVPARISLNVVSGDGKQLSGNITNIKFTDEQGNYPDMTLTKFTLASNSMAPAYTDVFRENFNDAFKSGDGKTVILEAVEAALNAPDLLRNASGQLSKFLNDTLKGRLVELSPGDAPVDNAATRYDDCLLTYLKYSVIKPSGKLYLPDIISKSKNPVLNPYKLGKDIDLGGFSIQDFVIDDVKLIDFTVYSANTAQPKSVNFAIDTISAEVGLADIYFASNVRVAVKKSVINGALTMSFDKDAYMTLSVKTSGGCIDDMKINFTALTVSAKSHNITYQSTPESSFDGVVASILNQNLPTSDILSKLNDAIKNNLGALSDGATAKIQSELRGL